MFWYFLLGITISQVIYSALCSKISWYPIGAILVPLFIVCWIYLPISINCCTNWQIGYRLNKKRSRPTVSSNFVPWNWKDTIPHLKKKGEKGLPGDFKLANFVITRPGFILHIEALRTTFTTFTRTSNYIKNNNNDKLLNWSTDNNMR